MRELAEVPSPQNPRGEPVLVEGSWEQTTVGTLDGLSDPRAPPIGRPLTGNRSSRNKARQVAQLAQRAQSPNQRERALPELKRYNPLKAREAPLDEAGLHQRSL